MAADARRLGFAIIGAAMESNVRLAMKSYDSPAAQEREESVGCDGSAESDALEDIDGIDGQCGSESLDAEVRNQVRHQIERHPDCNGNAAFV